MLLAPFVASCGFPASEIAFRRARKVDTGFGIVQVSAVAPSGPQSSEFFVVPVNCINLPPLCAPMSAVLRFCSVAVGLGYEFVLRVPGK